MYSMPARSVKFRLLLLLCCSLAFSANAQVNTDSLWQIWQNTGLADTIRVKALQAVAWDIMYHDPDSALLLARQELDFARQAGNKSWQGKAWNVIGSVYNLKGDNTTALECFEKGLALLDENRDRQGIGAINNNIGLIYRNQGNPLRALPYYQKDLAIQEAVGNPDGISNAYNNIGTIYNDLGDFPRALEYYQKTRAIQEERDDKWGLGIVYNNIGSVYSDQNKPEQALEFYEKSLRICRELDDQRGIASALINIGFIYKRTGRFESALDYLREGLRLYQELDDQLGLVNTYFYLGLLYQARRDHTQAIRWCRKALDESQVIGAIHHERNSCQCLYDSYKALGNTGQALAYHEHFMVLSDSLRKEETADQLQQMEFSRRILSDSLRKEAEKHQLEMSYVKQVRRKDQTRNILLIAGLVILALAIGFWSRMLYFRKHSELFQNKAEHLEKQQLVNEIALLRSQVNPHFLFNSLNILSSLVHTSPALAEQFIDQLSRSYRYILEQRDASLVSLKTELDFIQSYAFLLKIRFEHKFDLLLDVPADIQEQYEIAPLTLQLLVENAVKHNRMSMQAPLRVTIAVAPGPALEISNPLQPRPTVAPSTGMGMENIEHRYALLTDRPVWAGPKEGAYIVQIPLLENTPRN
ncbi:MAG: tetratricopeptide repeat protein [Bacteroidetes bacterium]|nr:MAG: tetratricopeptide repeat protein [Bacteroidota bacterium]